MSVDTYPAPPGSEPCELLPEASDTSRAALFLLPLAKRMAGVDTDSERWQVKGQETDMQRWEDKNSDGPTALELLFIAEED